MIVYESVLEGGTRERERLRPNPKHKACAFVCVTDFYRLSRFGDRQLSSLDM